VSTRSTGGGSGAVLLAQVKNFAEHGTVTGRADILRNERIRELLSEVTTKAR
jgi:hypothetical protein